MNRKLPSASYTAERDPALILPRATWPLVIALSLAPYSAVAQNWEIAAGAGASAAPGGRFGPVVGIGVERDLTREVRARLELRYLRKAGTGDSQTCGGPEPGHQQCVPTVVWFDWRTVEAPLLVVVSPPRLAPLYLVAGGYIGRHLACTGDIAAHCDLASLIDVGLGLGAGLALQVAQQRFRVEMRYHHGFVRSVARDTPVEVLVQPRVATLLLSYARTLPISREPPS